MFDYDHDDKFSDVYISICCNSISFAISPQPLFPNSLYNFYTADDDDDDDDDGDDNTVAQYLLQLLQGWR